MKYKATNTLTLYGLDLSNKDANGRIDKIKAKTLGQMVADETRDFENLEYQPQSGSVDYTMKKDATFS